MALIGLTLKSHPAIKRGGKKLKGQSKVLPCIFAGSSVSAAPQRLWPGAQWTIAGKPRHQPQAAMRGIFPRSPKGYQGLLQTSRGLWPSTPGKRVPVTVEATTMLQNNSTNIRTKGTSKSRYHRLHVKLVGIMKCGLRCQKSLRNRSLHCNVPSDTQ